MKRLRGLSVAMFVPLLLIEPIRCVNAVEAPPISAGTLTPTGALGIIRAAHTATLLSSGKVLITGGCAIQSCEGGPLSASTELYDPDARRFTQGPKSAHRRRLGPDAHNVSRAIRPEH